MAYNSPLGTYVSSRLNPSTPKSPDYDLFTRPLRNMTPNNSPPVQGKAFGSGNSNRVSTPVRGNSPNTSSPQGGCGGNTDFIPFGGSPSHVKRAKFQSWGAHSGNSFGSPRGFSPNGNSFRNSFNSNSSRNSFTSSNSPRGSFPRQQRFCSPRSRGGHSHHSGKGPDVCQYFNNSILDDPWAELEEKLKTSFSESKKVVCSESSTDFCSSVYSNSCSTSDSQSKEPQYLKETGSSQEKLLIDDPTSCNITKPSNVFAVDGSGNVTTDVKSKITSIWTVDESGNITQGDT